MNADAKRIEIQKLYGTDTFRGRRLQDMPENQIHAIYGQMMHSGIFDEYESLKTSYVTLFLNDIYTARKRANNMSIFQLREVIPKVIAEREKKLPEFYQFTLDDFLAERQIEEEKSNGKNA